MGRWGRWALYWDAGQNVVQIGRGGWDLYQHCLTWTNGLQVAGDLLGLVGNYYTWWRLPGGAPRSTLIQVGASKASVTVSGDTASVVTDYVHTLTDRRFFAAITDAARSQGATRMVVETGAIHDINLAIRLGEAAQRGRTIAGSRVTVTSPPGTTQPSFRITWDTIPKVTL